MEGIPTDVNGMIGDWKNWAGQTDSPCQEHLGGLNSLFILKIKI